MTERNRKTNTQPLSSLFRSQIVQKYPPDNPFIEDNEMDLQPLPQDKNDLFSYFMRENQIVQDFQDREEKPKRGLFSLDEPIINHNQQERIFSRHSSVSSRGNFPFERDNSLEKIPFGMKKMSDDGMDIEFDEGFRMPDRMEIHQQPPPAWVNLTIQQAPPPQIDLRTQKEEQKRNKIEKLQQVGCNCRKSKCLKMYCQCFHLQIYCGQNCNCVDCGNKEPNSGHKQAVIEALTRNPKAFQEEKPQTQGGFTLGVNLKEVKKGCKCKKTKCSKKYCQCFNSGVGCGIFCKCQNCENKFGKREV